MSRFEYDERDVQARVETLRRGDRIYLPGAGPASRGGGGRVVAAVETFDTWGLEQRPCVVVSYFTGERAKPMRAAGEEPDRTEPVELVQQQLKPLAPGTRVRCRRCRRVAAA